MPRSTRATVSVLLCGGVVWGFLAAGCSVEIVHKDGSLDGSTTGDASVTGCLGSCTGCGEFDDSTQCLDQDGCEWLEPGCVGTCEPCATLIDETDCTAQQGCTYNPVAPCTGTCTICDSYATQPACEAQAGCTFVPGHCTGTPDPCAGRSQGECGNGCTWDEEGPCFGGQQPCIEMNDHDTCDNWTNCKWESGECVTDIEDFFRCSNLDDETHCGYAPDACWWDSAGPCEGTPDPCAGRTEANCIDGCTWVDDDCSGTCTACGDITTGTDCNNQAGCTWDPQPLCVGTCEACDTYQAAGTCAAQQGCGWEDTTSCGGSCTSCDTYQSQPSCESQTGCHWVPPR